MGGVIPLSDASRRPRSFPIVTAAIIAVNAAVFLLELNGGDAFVVRWSLVPANIVAGHAWITVFTAMFMHASWSHILGNMIFLWAFGPEIEDAMSPLRYALFYLLGGFASDAGAGRCRSAFDRAESRGQRRHCGRDGRFSCDVSARQN
ncbi:MAG: rhomboid family intramembrane serine protease [Candidatus Acidiferrales bacterium]